MCASPFTSARASLIHDRIKLLTHLCRDAVGGFGKLFVEALALRFAEAAGACGVGRNISDADVLARAGARVHLQVGVDNGQAARGTSKAVGEVN